MDGKLKAGFVLFVVAVFLFSSGASKYDRKEADKDIAKGRALAEKIKMSDVLGPLAAVSISPYFGITLLSGATLLGQYDMIPTNSFLQGNPILGNWLVFILFLLLSGVTSIPKLTSPTKLIVESADMLEKYAGVIVYAVVIAASRLNSGPSEQVAVVYQAGIFSFTAQTVLILAAACNIVVINTVKFFFELLVLLSPIPLLDAIFEAANKTLCGALVVIYLFNPLLAFVINLILFLLCLLVYNWVYRRVRYLKCILLEPVIIKMLKIKDPLKRYQSKYESLGHSGKALAKVFPLKKIDDIKKKQLCVLFSSGDKYEIMTANFFTKPIFKQADSISEAENGLIKSTVEVKIESMDRPIEFAFAKHYSVVPSGK
ncbi:MAG TPA: hypothetical protein PLP05_08830 [Sedimentisphaerales bacterium]|nr:hypothetical protein [Sedimentisphaerales bacterium]